jgi:hypothetical protein
MSSEERNGTTVSRNASRSGDLPQLLAASVHHCSPLRDIHPAKSFAVRLYVSLIGGSTRSRLDQTRFDLKDLIRQGSTLRLTRELTLSQGVRFGSKGGRMDLRSRMVVILEKLERRYCLTLSSSTVKVKGSFTSRPLVH